MPINVSTPDGVVTLVGTVDSVAAVRRAGATAVEVYGVIDVENKLALLPISG